MTKKLNNTQKVIKTIQALCFGVFALGVSLMASDASAFYKTPFSSLSITTTLVGLLGVGITQIICKQAEKYDD